MFGLDFVLRQRFFGFGQRKTPQANAYGVCGDPSEIRTPDTLIKSQVLCQLS